MINDNSNMQVFGEKVKGYLRRNGLTLQRFAPDVPLDYSTLSSFLRGKYSTPQAETHIRHIVMALAQKDMLKNQGEAKELLDLAGCPYFSESEWKSPPLNKLVPRSPSISQERAQPQKATTVHITAEQVRVVIDDTTTSPTPTVEASPFIFMVPPPPSIFVPRPQEYEALKQALLQQSDSSTPITTAAEGTGGYGKTTLALKLCYDRDIWKAFHDGICFVSLGKKPVDLLGTLNDLITYISKKRSNFSSLDAATVWLRDLLADRALLLVIDDVWHISDLTPFLQGGSQCAYLITTRMHSVVPAGAVSIRIDEMRREEALQLLCRGIDFSVGNNIDVFNNESVLLALIKDMGSWPLLLALANSTLRERMNYLGQTFSEALLALQQTLKKQGIVAFDERDDRTRHTAVSACLETSLDLLGKKEGRLFLELAVFPEDASIPLQTVFRLWKKAGDLERWEAEELCLQLYRLSLLRVLDHKAQIIQIHDIIREYLLSKVGSDQWVLHVRLLDAYDLARWADLSLEEPYLWKYLAWHLVKANRISQLLETLKDLNYIAAKAFSVGTSAVEMDLITAIEHAPDDDVLRLLKRSLARAGHALNLGETLQEVQNTVLILFQHIDMLSRSCAMLENEIAPPYFRGRYPLPKESTTALIRTLVTSSPLDACAISPDGTQIVSISSDGTIVIWDLDTGKKRQALKGALDLYDACAISHDNASVITIAKSGMVTVWDVITGNIQRTLDISSFSDLHSAKACAISLDGNQIFIVTFDGTVIIYDLGMGAVQRAFRLLDIPVACTISPDGTQMTSVSLNGTIKIRDTYTGEVRQKLDACVVDVYPRSVSLDGTLIVSDSPDGVVTTWDTATGKMRQKLVGHSREVTYSLISPDNTYIVSASLDKTVKIWDPQAIENQPSAGEHSKEIVFCSIKPDGTQIIFLESDGTMQVQDVHTGKVWQTVTGKPGKVRTCAIKPDGTQIVSISPAGDIEIRDLPSGEVKKLALDLPTMMYVAISPDCRWLAFDRGAGIIEIRDTETGKVRQILEDPPKGLGESAKFYTFNSSSTWFGSACWNGTVRIWDIHNGKVLQTLESKDLLWTSCAFSPNGALFAAASWNGTIKIWDIHTGKVLQTLESQNNSWTSCAFSSDGAWLTTASWEGSLKIWEISNGTCIAAFYASGPLKWCAFCSDESTLVAASKRGLYFLDLVKK